MDVQTKLCRECQVEKPADQFHKAKKASDGLQYRCIACSKLYHAQRYLKEKDKIQQQIQAYRAANKERLVEAGARWRSENREKVRVYQRTTNLRKNFGLSLEEYASMEASQNSCCAICKRPETYIHKATNEVARLAVDHCHKTGKVRALLCKSCNNGLGLFKDDADVLASAIAYLKEHNV
jgi:hypothetical protein